MMSLPVKSEPVKQRTVSLVGMLLIRAGGAVAVLQELAVEICLLVRDIQKLGCQVRVDVVLICDDLENGCGAVEALVENLIGKRQRPLVLQLRSVENLGEHGDGPLGEDGVLPLVRPVKQDRCGRAQIRVGRLALEGVESVANSPGIEHEG